MKIYLYKNDNFANTTIIVSRGVILLAILCLVVHALYTD